MNYCNLQEIALTTVRELSNAHGERFILETDHDSILGFWNEEGIRRVIENLSNNAVKFGAPESFIKISLKQLESFVQITIHNIGEPIPEDDQRILFCPARRISTSQHTEKKGWGLGLIIVKGIVQAHGGNIAVVSNKENGTSFIITLPKDARSFQLLN